MGTNTSIAGLTEVTIHTENLVGVRKIIFDDKVYDCITSSSSVPPAFFVPIIVLVVNT
jgi:hypothetical protein